MHKVSLILFVLLIIINPASAWFDTNLKSKYNIPVVDGFRPVVVSVNLSNNTSPFANNTHLNLSVCSQPQCTDIIFVINNQTEIPYWRETNLSSGTYGTFRFNLTENGSVQIYYNSTTPVLDHSNGNLTFTEFDDFNRVFVGNNWTLNTGTWTTNNNALQVVCPGSASNCRALYNWINLSSKDISVEINSSHTTITAGVGVILTADNINNDPEHNGYLFQLVESGTKLITRVDNTVLTTLSSGAGTTFGSGYHNIKITKTDGLMNFDVDGIRQLTAQDTKYTNGFVGFFCNSPAASQTCTFENLKVMPFINQTILTNSWGNRELSPTLFLGEYSWMLGEQRFIFG